MNPFSGSLTRRLKDRVSWQGLYAAGVFALLCFSLLDLLVPQRSADLFEPYGRFLLAALFGVFLFRAGLPREWVLRLHLGYLLWLLLTRWLNGDVYLFIDWKIVRCEVISFLMLSVGILLSPDGRRRLLNILSLVYAGFFVFFSLLGLFVSVTNTYIHIPPENVWITTLSTINPIPLLNLLSSFRLTTAGRLYISWGLLGYQAVRTQRKGLRVLLLLGMLVLYFAIALCYSHTIWITTSLSCAMFLLLLGYRRLRMRSTALRVLILAVGFIAVFSVVYKGFELSLRLRDVLRPQLAARFEQRYEAWEHKPDPEFFGIALPEEPEESEVTSNTFQRNTAEQNAETGDIYLDPPRSFKTAYTLSWRTLIWESVPYCIRKNPAILLRGQLTKGIMARTNAYLAGVYRIHAQPSMHNYLFQSILLTGLPGFLMVLFWTLLIVVRMIRMFFSREETVPLSIAFLTIPMTGMFLFNMMEYELFPAWDSSSQAFLLLAGVFLGLYREYVPDKKATARAE